MRLTFQSCGKKGDRGEVLAEVGEGPVPSDCNGIQVFHRFFTDPVSTGTSSPRVTLYAYHKNE